MPETIIPPVLTSQSPKIDQELSTSDIKSAIETEQIKEHLPLNEINPSESTQILNNTNSPVADSTSTVQQIPYSIPSVSGHFPPQISTFQNPSVPAFQLMNSQYNTQQQTSISETIKPFVLTPQVTALLPFTSESTTIPTSQGLTIPSVLSLQSVNNQEMTYQSLTVVPPHSYDQYRLTEVGGSTTIADVPKSKELNNYFSQFQTQPSSPNNSSTIPMFSVKNFPQMSSLAQPLGKLYILFLFLI